MLSEGKSAIYEEFRKEMTNQVKASNINETSRVLLVDDEPDIVYPVKRGLERNGLQVDAYTDPLLALQDFKRRYTNYFF
jgi:PleD family two-component response regulator